MPSSMRLWTLLFVASCADETSLIQDVKKPSKSHRKGDTSVTNLMEAATNLLKNGATPDVVDFTEATVAEVTDVVIPAINNESATDQQSLYDTHAMFGCLENVLYVAPADYAHDGCPPDQQSLATDNLEVFQFNFEETEASDAHKQCRSLESPKCEEKRSCDMELYRLYVIWTEQEELLKELHHSIDGQFCVPGEEIDGEWVGGVNGTLEAFRTRVVPYMHQYRTQKPIVDHSITTYNAQIPTCDDNVFQLDTKSGECNAKQSELEIFACRHAERISSTLSDYHSEYARVNSMYQVLLETVLRKQEDRIQEYVTLQVVNCLLGRVHERNGRPCDESTGEVDEELSHCEEERLDVDYTHLELVYPPAPPLVPNCPSRHEVVGACQPVLQPVPCNNDYHQQEYGALPAVPEEPFSETNPGCNAYPACSACSAPAPPPVFFIGTTVDGCRQDNANSRYRVEGGDTSGVTIPTVVHTDAAHTASVRCCSHDGHSCSSEYLIDTAESELGCAVGHTKAEAIAVCAANDMRLCMEEEMYNGVCCRTGCWFNHHAVWVATDPRWSPPPVDDPTRSIQPVDDPPISIR